MDSFRRAISAIVAGRAGATLILAGGTVAAQLILLLLLPLTTRIYPPEKVGIVATLIAFVNVVGTASTLRFSTAILLPRSASGATNVMMAAFVSLALMTCVLAAFLYLGAISTKVQHYGDYSAYIVVAFVFGGINEIGSSLALRRKKYSLLATTKVLRHGGGEAGKVFLGIFSPSIVSLLAGHLVALTASTCALFSQAGVLKKRVTRLRVPGVVRAARKYRQFPIYHLPAELFRAASFNAPIFMFAVLYGPKMTGLLGMAMMMVSASSALVAQSVRQVFLSQIAREASDTRLIHDQLKQYSKWLFLAGAGITILVWFLAKPAIDIVLGDAWNGSAKFAKILSIQLVPQFLAVAIAGPIFTVLRRDVLILATEVRRMLLVFLVLGACYLWQFQPEQALYLYSFTLAVHFALIFVRAKRECTQMISP